MVSGFGLAVALGTLLLGTPLNAQAADAWRVGSFEDQQAAGPFHRIVSEAYARIGLKAHFEPVPLLRGESLLGSGDLDAVLARTEQSAAKLPFALKVGVPLRLVEYVAVRQPPCAPRLELAELARLRVTLQRGSGALEAALPAGPKVPALDPHEALRYVQGGMADLAALPLTPAMRTAVEREGFCTVAEPLLVVPFFHLIHTRHAAWLPRLDSALKDLERSGFTARVWQDAERDYAGWQLKLNRPGASSKP
ncbi:hypothetical protein [Inhella gelatinilytica]|uniref:Solute-binding protein family 3/N-terminal domain-containing protein n=1 Tax=Inhella gelatinilytica TaxID=2795030 RepID=A0A931ITV3_9BURK|nr:hypothetical protein [Inhella gelatinilytica]MBH9551426.1 hypothetical protein [Inhella gelatinilytica]